jgi:hypothetical protein
MEMPSTFGNHPWGVISDGETQKDRLDSDWKWGSKLVGGSIREIRLGANSEKRWRAARRKAADSTLPGKSSSEPHR